MEMTEFEKVSLWLGSWKEDELRQVVLKPLLVAQGYQEVSELHGTTELGKDLVAWSNDVFGLRRDIAIVAKAEKLTGSALQVEVFRQVLQAFNADYADPITGISRTVQDVFVITNKRVKPITRDSIQALFEEKYRGHVHIIDVDQLTQQWMHHFPLRVAGQLARTQQLMSEIDSPFKSEVRLTETEQQYDILEREPGVTSEEDRKFQGSFEFPDTPEGRLLLDEVRDAFETGAPLNIKGPFISFQLPRIMREYLAELGIDAPETFDSFQTESVPDDRRFPFRIEFVGDDGLQFSLEYVEFSVQQGGTRIVTVSNAHQPIPVHFEQVIDFAEKSVVFRVTRPQDPIPAYWYSRFMQTLARMSQPGWLRFISLESGLISSAHPTKGDSANAVSREDLEVALMLERIEQKLAQPILVSSDRWAPEDVREILRLDEIVSNPVQEVTNVRFSLGFETDDIKSLVESFGPSNRFVFARSESSKVFGQDLDLGRVQYLVQGPTLMDWREDVDDSVSAHSGRTYELFFESTRADQSYVSLGAPPFVEEGGDEEQSGFARIL